MKPLRMPLRTLALSTLLLWLSNASVMAAPFRITHNQPFPPLSELKNGKSEGLLIDVLRAAGARVGLEIEFVAAPLDQMEQTLKDGRRSEERRVGKECR